MSSGKMDKPSMVLPSVPTTTPSPMPPQIQDASIFGAAFDQLLKQRGIRFLHERVMPCPNVKSLDADNHEPTCTFCDSSGYLYYDPKNIVGVFHSNNLEKIYEKQGVWELGNAMVTMPAEYDDGVQAEFAMFDRLTALDFTVRLWEMKEYEPTGSMSQRVRYPIQKVEIITSIVNNVQKEYKSGIDFNVVSGNIVWGSGKQPGYNKTTERGEVFSISYYAAPVFAVYQTTRELRVTQEVVNGQKVARRLPQQLLIRRDFLPQAAEKVGTLE